MFRPVAVFQNTLVAVLLLISLQACSRWWGRLSSMTNPYPYPS
jgi:hypothetical protein